MPFVAVPSALPHALSRPRVLRSRERSVRPWQVNRAGKRTLTAGWAREDECVSVIFPIQETRSSAVGVVQFQG